jgi:type IX secretion system PorP/SprF family membrane protein
MRKRIIHIGLLMMLLVQNLYSQDLTFSQFYENPLLRNPALAGVFEGDIRVIGTFRNQWQAITVPFQTGAFSTEVKFPVGKADDWITAGVQVTHDRAGDIQLKRTQLLPVINYHKSLSGDNDNYLSAAFMFGPVNSQFDPTQLRLDEQFINGSFNPNNPTSIAFSRTGYTYWDMSTGISYSSSLPNNVRYYIGGGIFHFNQPKVGFYSNNEESRLQRKYVLNGGITFPLSDINKLIFYADYFRQGGNEQFLGGTMYGIDILQSQSVDLFQNISVYFGAFYRWNDAFIPVVKLDMYALSAGLSYDANVSRLRTASQSRGGIEFTLSYKAQLSNRNSGRDKLKCIRF